MSSHTSLNDHCKHMELAESMSIQFCPQNSRWLWGLIVLSCIVSCVRISEKMFDVGDLPVLTFNIV